MLEFSEIKCPCNYIFPGAARCCSLGSSFQRSMVPPMCISLGLSGSQGLALSDKTYIVKPGVHDGPHGTGWSSGGPETGRPWQRNGGLGTGFLMLLCSSMELRGVQGS